MMAELQLERTEEPDTLIEKPDLVSLNTTDDLKTQCNACSENLRTCVKVGLKASRIDYTFTRTILAPLYRRLDEHRLRWDIWLSDCRLSDNDVLEMASHEPFGKLLSAQFRDFHEELGLIFQGINSIANFAGADMNSTQSSHENEIRDTEVMILKHCDRLTSHLLKLVKLQPSIQMASAIRLSAGSNAALRSEILRIKESINNQQHADEGYTESEPTEGSTSRTSTDEQCPGCGAYLPWNALPLHIDHCKDTGKQFGGYTGRSMSKDGNRNIDTKKGPASGTQQVLAPNQISALRVEKPHNGNSFEMDELQPRTPNELSSSEDEAETTGSLHSTEADNGSVPSQQEINNLFDGNTTGPGSDIHNWDADTQSIASGRAYSSYSGDTLVGSIEEAKDFAENDPGMEVTQSPNTLSTFGVVAIIANRMIGSGIFDTPTIILQQNHNVGVCIMFWVAGILVSLAGTYIYVEYGLTIPRYKMDRHTPGKLLIKSGGELDYLNYLLPRPKYMATSLISFILILVGNSAANCISCAAHFLAAGGISSPNTGVIHGIALGIAWGACLIHVFGRVFRGYLNAVFTLVKIIFLWLIILFGFAGVRSTSRDPDSFANLSTSESFTNFGTPGNFTGDYSASFLKILFTIGGFAQANYVLGEIKQPARKIFKKTSLLAVGFISILYLLVFIAYMIVVPLPRDGHFPANFSVPEEFFKLTIGKLWSDAKSLQLMHACVGVSSLGNVIIATFTAAQMKREISKTGILPYSLLVSRSTFIKLKTRNKIAQRILANFSSPLPSMGLVLHATFTTILILSTFAISSKDDYLLLVGIYSYSVNAMVGVCLSFGIIYMRLRPRSGHQVPWKTISTSNGILSLIAASVFFIANIFPIIGLWVPSRLSITSVPWEVVPTTGWSLVAGGLVYWFIFWKVIPFRSGRVLQVRRQTVILQDPDRGDLVQIAELVSHRWVVPPSE